MDFRGFCFEIFYMLDKEIEVWGDKSFKVFKKF